MENIISMVDIIKTKVIDLATEYGIKLIIALLLLLIGWQVIKHLVNITEKAFTKAKMDVSLSKFLLSAIRVALKFLLIMMVLEQLDIETAPLIAVLGAAGLGVGLALQGSLSNLAGGVLILFLRPFSIGEYIKETAYGNEGVVEDIHVLYTTLKTRDNKVITVPNGKLSNESIINFSRKERRRVDLEFGVDYKEDNNKVKAAIRSVVEKHPLILKDEEPVIRMSEHGDSAVVYITLVWCLGKDYFQVKFDLLEQVKEKFDEENINIPYPHMDVNIINQK